MEEQNELRLPLVASEYTLAVRSGLRCVIFGLAQYVNQLPNDSRERQLCFEALDGLVMRFQIGSGKDIYLQDHEIGELLHAFGGFLLTMYYQHPPSEKGRLRLFITDWCARFKEQVERT
jgi:hypothetical protein